jgi:hypothetical protein
MLTELTPEHTTGTSDGADGAVEPPVVRKFRQICLWPVQLMPRKEGDQVQKHWELPVHPGEVQVWKEVVDEFPSDPTQFTERHYKEFVTFLPYVQRFLYGESASIDGEGGYGRSPIRVFRREDVAHARMTFPGDPRPVLFDVAHVDLYLFYDIDIAILVVEIFAENLTLARALDARYRFGRVYPTHWEPSGRGGHCVERVEWLGWDGRVLSASDYEKRDRYLAFVGQHRVAHVASHWDYLLRPLVLHHSDQSGAMRYREIEYQRMPLLGYLAFDDRTRLTRGDLIRIGLVTRPGDPETWPYSERFLQDFEYRYCYDRYWEENRSHDWPDTRFLCNGHAFTIIGNAGEPFFTDEATGVLSQFRHQYFLLGLMAHFHKAALLMLADRLVVAISRLDIHQPASIRMFKRSIRLTMGIFLRFTHRYWFHEVSDQAQAREIFRMWTGHLGTDALYEEVRQRIQDMTYFLDSDQLRRQAETVVRLTVVTVFGLVVNIVTGYFGMNLIAAADSPLPLKIGFFVLAFVPTLALILYVVAKSKRLSEFLESLSDERLGTGHKLGMLLNVWKKGTAPHRSVPGVH